MEKYTDQYFTYRETPVDYDSVGNITRIKGNTLAWNQLVENGNFVSKSVWLENVATYSVSNNEASFTMSQGSTGIYQTLAVVSGHKYLWWLDINTSNMAMVGSNDAFGGRYLVSSGYGSYQRITGIATANQTTCTFVIYTATANATTIKVKNVCIFDLTKMFGAGNEPTSVSDFTSLFSLSYYPYDGGSLLSFMGTGIKTTNADESKESTTDLPVLTYFPTGMKSAGDVYDELTPSKAITRVGSVDLGTLLWSRNTSGTNPVFIATISDSASLTELSAITLRCAKYESVGAMALGAYQSTSLDKTVCKRSNNQTILVQDSSYTSASDFETAMSGVYLYYELATESEQDINISMFYPIYADGTEQILPTSDTSPFFGDLEYYNGPDGETNIRKFWLINGNNERWDLTEKDFKAFLNNPQGLGFRKTVESVRYGERQNKVSETYNFPQPQGELLFYDSYNSTRYDKYNQFIRFLMNQPITLYYMIPVSYASGIANIYTLDCEVTEVQKTESKTDNILRSSIVFNGMEFYKGDPITVNGTGTSYTLTNEGDFPVGFEITIEGSLTNPYITLEQGEELYGEAKFDDSTAFSSVYVNSNDGEQNVVLMQSDAVLPNPLSYQDLSISNGSIYVTFVKLARGESTLTIGMGSGSITGVSIKYTPKYRSV